MATPTITAGPVSLYAAVSRIPVAARVAAFGLAVIATEFVIAAGVVKGGRVFMLLLMLVAVGAQALVFRFPLPTALVLLGFTDFVFHGGFFPALGYGPANLYVYEATLAALLLVACVRPRRRTWGGIPGAALAIFLLLVTVSGFVAIGDGRASVSDVFQWGRSLGLLTIFYVVVRLFPEPEQRRTLLTGAAILAALTGVAALAVALGSGLGDVLKDAGTQIVRQEEGVGGINRVRLAGLSAGYALFWYVATQIAASRGNRRAGWCLVLGGIALDILVSFNRNMWSGLVLGMAMMMIVGGSFLRSRLVIGIVVGAVGIALITAVSPSGQDRLIDPVVKRGSTIVNPKEVSREGSYRARRDETLAAWGTAKHRLLLGVGPGAEFGVWVDDPIGSNSYVRAPQLFLHNQYLYFLAIGGLPALLAFLVFLGSPVLRAIRRRPHDLSIVACAVGIVSIMISAAVAIYFTAGDMGMMLGILAGVIVADSEGRAAEGRGSGLTE